MIIHNCSQTAFNSNINENTNNMDSSTDRMSLLTNFLASPTEENKARTMSLFAELLTENAKMSQKLTRRKSQKKKIGDLERQLEEANSAVARHQKYAADLIDTYQAKQRTMREEVNMLKIDVAGKTAAAEAQKALTDAKAKALDESEGAVNDLRAQLAKARSDALAAREQLDAARQPDAARDERIHRAAALREQCLRDQLAEARSDTLAAREQLDAAQKFNAARNEATALREQHLRDQLAEKEGAF